MTEPQPFAPVPSPLDPDLPTPGGDDATPPTTGSPRVDAALAALADATDLPPIQQIEPLTEAHHALRETLESIGDV